MWRMCWFASAACRPMHPLPSCPGLQPAERSHVLTRTQAVLRQQLEVPTHRGWGCGTPAPLGRWCGGAHGGTEGSSQVVRVGGDRKGLPAFPGTPMLGLCRRSDTALMRAGWVGGGADADDGAAEEPRGHPVQQLPGRFDQDPPPGGLPRPLQGALPLPAPLPCSPPLPRVPALGPQPLQGRSPAVRCGVTDRQTAPDPGACLAVNVQRLVRTHSSAPGSAAEGQRCESAPMLAVWQAVWQTCAGQCACAPLPGMCGWHCGECACTEICQIGLVARLESRVLLRPRCRN